MWHHYKKTFVRMQIVVSIIIALVYFCFGHLWQQAAVFFGVMQISLIIGSVWAARLAAILERRREALPLEARL